MTGLPGGKNLLTGQAVGAGGGRGLKCNILFTKFN